MPPEAPPPADWYIDPDDPSAARYWDGQHWTDLRAALPEDFRSSTPQPRFAAALPSRRRRLVTFTVIGALFAAGGIAAVAVARSDPDVQARVAGTNLLRVRGGLEVDLPDTVGAVRGQPCQGAGEFSSVGSGAEIEVRDLRGRRIANAPLASGRTVKADFDDGDPLSSPVSCRFEFTLELPDRDAYRIGVSGFGDQRYAREELADRGWRVELGLRP